MERTQLAHLDNSIFPTRNNMSKIARNKYRQHRRFMPYEALNHLHGSSFLPRVLPIPLRRRVSTYCLTTTMPMGNTHLSYITVICACNDMLSIGRKSQGSKRVIVSCLEVVASRSINKLTRIKSWGEKAKYPKFIGGARVPVIDTRGWIC